MGRDVAVIGGGLIGLGVGALLGNPALGFSAATLIAGRLFGQEQKTPQPVASEPPRVPKTGAGVAFAFIDGGRLLAVDGVLTVPDDPADGKGGVVLNGTAIGCSPNGGVVRTTATEHVRSPGSFGHHESDAVTTTTDTLTIAVAFASALTGPVYFDQFAVNGQVLYDRYPPSGGSGGYAMTDVVVGSTVVGAVSSDGKFEMWYGTRQQPVSPIMASVYAPDPYPAHRGIAYIVWTGPIQSIPTFNVLARNDRTLASEIVTARLAMVGWDGVTPLIDPTDLNICLGDNDQHLRGVYQLNSGPPRPICENVLAMCDQQFAEVDGQIVTVSISDPPTVTLDSDELGAHDAGSNDANSFNTVKVTPVDLKDLPSSYTIGYFDIDTLSNDTAPSVWPGATHSNAQTADYGIVATKPEMLAVARKQHALIRVADATVECAVPIDRLGVIPGTIATVPLLQGGTLDFRIGKLTLGNFLTLSGSTWNNSPFNPGPTVVVAPPPPVVVPVTGTIIGFLADAVPYKDSMAGSGPPTGRGYLVAAAGTQTGATWPSAFLTYHLGPTPALSHSTGLPTQAVLGLTVGALGSPASSVFDYDHPQQIQLYNESFALQSITGSTRDEREANALSSRANLLLAENGCYFQFSEAEDLGDGLYEVTGIRAYRYGSDYLSSVPDGTKVVMVYDEDGLESTALGLADYETRWIGTEVSYAFHKGTFDPGGATPATLTKTIVGNTMLPLSPVFLENTPSSGLAIDWVERSRYPEATMAWWGSGGTFPHSDDVRFQVAVEVDGADRVDWPFQSVTTDAVAMSAAQMDFLFSFRGFPTPSTFDGYVAQVSAWVGQGHRRAYSDFS